VVNYDQLSGLNIIYLVYLSANKMEENAESSSNENQLEKAMNSEGETRNPTTSKKTGLSPI